ncbi:threonine-phosphate decarboxylase CobD [Rhodovibrionaceae bacterium A322]
MTAETLSQQAAPIYHGGNLDAVRLRYPEVETWLDLSTGISPWSYPVGPIEASSWQALPGNSKLEALLLAARDGYGALPDAPCLATPGSQAAIQWLPRVVREEAEQSLTVAVLGFTYKEHANCWRLAGHEVTEVENGSQDLLAAAHHHKVVVLANPNNPDGGTHDPQLLLQAADLLAQKGGWLVVDEAFGDLTPDLSLVRHCPRPGLLVLRSLGKFYGLAGLRVGFLFGPEELVSALSVAQGPWALSGPALDLASLALQDREWQQARRLDMQAQANALIVALRRCDLDVIGGTDLFVLARHARASQIFDQLCQQGILLRPFPERPRWLRFGLPGSKESLSRLEGALKNCPALQPQSAEA